MAKCIVVMYNHKVPNSFYSIISRKALKKMFQIKGDAAKILAILSAKLGRVTVRERQDSTASCPPELNTKIDPLREHKCETFPRSGNSRKRGLWQRKLSLTVEQERGLLQDYSKSLPRGKKEKELKVKTHFEVDFEDSTCEEEIDIEELKRILANPFNSEGESSIIEDDGFLTTTLCSTEL